MAYFPENIDDWRKIAYLVERADRICITTHVNPDGDALGSEIALADFLSGMGKPHRTINCSPTPESFRFLDPYDEIELYREDIHRNLCSSETELVFFLDLGKYERAGALGERFNDCPASKVIIDHHPPEPVDADVVVVNSRAASTGSLVYDLINFIDSSLITERIALAILTAVVTDTGYFRYSNTTETTHLIASSLYRHGANVTEIRRRLETGYPVCRQKLMGLTLSRLKTTYSGQIAFSCITREMFEEAGAKREHTDGIIDQIRLINGTKIAFLVIQEDGERFKVSFRSGDGASVNKIAAMLGGGGHPRAAGANLIGSLETVTNHVLEAAREYLEDEE